MMFCRSGVVAGNLERALDRLGPGVAVVEAMRPRHRRNPGKPLGERDQALVVEIGARHVDQFAGLLLNGRDDLRVTVPGRNNSDAGGKVQKLVAVDVFHAQAAAALRHHGVRACVLFRSGFSGRIRAAQLLCLIAKSE
jgi:hypothetical protein